MLCGWLARSGGGGHGAAVVNAMAHAVRVHARQQVVVHHAPGDLFIAMLTSSGEKTDPRSCAPAVSSNRRFWLWMTGEAYAAGRVCAVGSAAFSRTLAFREMLLEAMLTRGADAIAEVDGRYQVVLFDSLARTATIVADRFGGQPLFWATSKAGAAFGGGVRGVLMAPGIDCEPDEDAIREAVTFGGTRLGARTNVRGVQRLRGGSMLVLDDAARIRHYWSWPSLTRSLPRPSDPTELIEEAHRLWQRAVAVRLDGAVRPGQTLSGGLDSRAILAEAAPRAPTWTALTFGIDRCDDARYAQRAAAAVGATWVFRPLYHGVSPDWLERRTAFVQETDGLVQLADLLHHESLETQAALIDLHVSGYIGDAVCGTTFDGVVDAPSLLSKMPYSGVPIGWSWELALDWAAGEIARFEPAAAKYILYEHKLPQSIHPIFQAYAPYFGVRSPFTDYALFDFFAATPNAVRRWLYPRWLTRHYPSLFRSIPDQRTGVPAGAPARAIALARARRGATRASAAALRRLGLPAPPTRIRAYHDEHRHWALPPFRSRIEEAILWRGSLSAEIFGRDALTGVVRDFFDRATGPVQVIGALYAYEVYHRDLAAHLRAAARAAELDADAPVGVLG